MRTRCVIALACLLAGPATAAEQEFPYNAYIARDEAALRSGPGRNYYATEKLPLGEAIEIHRHEEGWCAIRPPEASFSWVRADDLRIGRNGIGIVLAEGAASRVGTNTSGLRDVIQVRLERGEEVEVLDAVQVSNDNGVEFYCKIAPPSGEFRWIYKDDVSREEPAADSAGLVEPSTTHRRTRNPAEDDGKGDDRDVRADRWGSWVKSRRTDVQQTAGASSAESNSSGNSSSKSSPGAETGRSIALAAGAAEDSGSSRTTQDRRAAGRIGEAASQAELKSIDRELSRIVVEEPAQWDFKLVQERVDAVIREAQNEQVRNAVGDLQERIDRFEDIRRRSLAASSPTTASDDVGKSQNVGALAVADSQTRHVLESHSSSLSSTPRLRPEGGRRAEGRDSQPPLRHGESSIGETRPREYDGVGKLARVVSQRPGAPRYALVNNANEVVAFVSPGSGVDLQSFEGQHVGISGGRGYMPELKKPHVTALRVNALGGGQARVARGR